MIKISGIQTAPCECCSDEESADIQQNEPRNENNHAGTESRVWKTYLPAALSLLMLLIGIALDSWFQPAFFSGWLRLLWYVIAYVPVGFPVMLQVLKTSLKGEVFTEFFLMSIATIGAFALGEYAEGVAVMLFYTVGELFQAAAVNKSKKNIKALLDIRPKTALVLQNGKWLLVHPETVKIGNTIQVKPGEKVPLDGELLSATSDFNTAALTGESLPRSIEKGEMVLAGMVSMDKVVEIKVAKAYNDSSLARILKMVQEATARKAKTEQFIRKFARVYTPIVVLLAVCLTVLPYFIVDSYVFEDWLYRSLIFLVISCPCALVISIPLGYFGGIGAASRHGILFKGSNFLDIMTKVNTVVMDKTGTLTKGLFTVQEIRELNGFSADTVLKYASAIESYSNHPVARAIVQYNKSPSDLAVDDVQEISGHGLKGLLDGKTLLAGNLKLMQKFDISLPDEAKNQTDTLVYMAYDGTLCGYIAIADEMKADSAEAIKGLHRREIETVMLSGDKQTVVDKVAAKLSIDKAFGDLLPENKVQKVEEIKRNPAKIAAFMGDGINDSPVLAASDVGLAMGGLGSDAAIETADVVIQSDRPSKINTAISISKATNRIVWQNIALAFGVKAIVLALGAGGLATMWEAVFADVGVAFLAILNAIRIQRMHFD